MTRRCSSTAECQLPKLDTGVRFPSPAPGRQSRTKDGFADIRSRRRATPDGRRPKGDIPSPAPYGLVAQLGERTVRIREVRGFDPLRVHHPTGRGTSHAAERRNTGTERQDPTESSPTAAGNYRRERARGKGRPETTSPRVQEQPTRKGPRQNGISGGDMARRSMPPEAILPTARLTAGPTEGTPKRATRIRVWRSW